MFAVIFICGNLFLRIAGKTAKISCHTVYWFTTQPSFGSSRLARHGEERCVTKLLRGDLNDTGQ